MKPIPPEGSVWDAESRLFVREGSCLGAMRFNPHGATGDLLYVRETWIKVPDPDPELGGFEIRYRATDSVDSAWYGGWRPSIHMPKWAARTWLRVTGVRV